MDVHNLRIDTLVHPEYNPRQISEKDFEQLKVSIKKFTAVEPAVINKHKGRDGIIVGGNQRIRAALSLGWDEFPCVYVDLTEKRERELNVRLNKNTGSFDFDILANQFDMGDLLEWGFEKNELIGGDFDLGDDGGNEDDSSEPNLCACPKCGHKFDPNRL